MSLRDILLGRPLASSEAAKEKLGVLTGIPVLGLDALASLGYGPEAALTILLPLGVLGLRYMPIILLAIVAELTMLYLSYRQTCAAYPNGGGAYIVAKDNFGMTTGLCAAVALLIDYLLNVCVAISSGIGAVVSAIPALHPYTLTLCLVVLLTLTIVNLRGVRESGVSFAVPTIAFVGCIGVTLVIGLTRALASGGHPQPVIAPPPVPRATEAVSLWLLLGAFANGCTAMTGVEAVSNGVPLFRKPTVANAQWTLTAIVGVLGLFLLGVGYVSPAYHIAAMDQRQPGYQTVLSQLVSAVVGHGIFYYVAATAIFFVLTYSAQTSFVDFPRVCRLLAEDRFLPPAFANRGPRLVFSAGIIILAVISGLGLIAFEGITENLIPLFAVGAFSAFLFSQSGMVVHWLRKSGRGVGVKLFFNGLGAVTTGVALAMIIVAKFIQGAWITLLVAPALVFLLRRIRRHYEKLASEVGQPLKLKASKLEPPLVIVPIDGWNRVAERAVRFGLLLSDDIIALHVTSENEDNRELREIWAEKVEKPAKAAKTAVPRLEIIHSPYRELYQPILDFISKAAEKRSHGLVAVIIPELVEPHWYEYLLHNQSGARLKALLYLQGGQRTVVINVPWYLRDL